ncbi:MAG: hypothetical protein AAGN82_28365 [Myxococcota bacterium]
MERDHLVFQVRTEADGHIIVQLGEATVRMDREGFFRLVAATNRAAARIDGRTALSAVN